MSISSLLSNANKTEKVVNSDQLAEDLKAALAQLQSAGVYPEYASDLRRLAEIMVSLVAQAASPTYSVVNTLLDIELSHTILHSLERYIRKAQQSFIGYCVTNQKTGRMLPSLFFSKAEAVGYIERTAPMFDLSPMDFSITEVSYAATTVGQPIAPPALSYSPSPPIPVNSIIDEEKIESTDVPAPIPAPIPSSLPPAPAPVKKA